MSGEKFYETIIIGAGPAGLTAGRYLKDALVLDKKKEIGKPVQCGEGLSCNALKIQNIKPDPLWISSEINCFERIMPNGKIISGSKKITGYVLNRPDFENYLYKNLKANIKLNEEVLNLSRLNDLWRVESKSGEVFTSKYLIGADGPHSIVRKNVFAENKEKMEFITAIEYLTQLDKELDINVIKIYFNNEKFKQGYAWVFPKSKNTANVGICGKGDLRDSLNFFWDKIIRNNYGNYKIIENRSGIIPIRKLNFRIFKNNAMLVGDAAGFADPFLKGGMSQAMQSAKIAAECILNRNTASYENIINSTPFAKFNLIEAAKAFYSLDNRTLNDLGEVFEGKGISYVKSLAGIIDFAAKPSLCKNIYKLSRFFTIWWKKREYLW